MALATCPGFSPVVSCVSQRLRYHSAPPFGEDRLVVPLRTGLTFIRRSVLTLKQMARTALDMEILEGLVAAPRPVATLIGQHPRATVYRHVAKLRSEGLIAPSRHGYALTSVGQRVLADHEVRVFRNGLSDVYPPLGAV